MEVWCCVGDAKKKNVWLNRQIRFRDKKKFKNVNFSQPHFALPTLVTALGSGENQLSSHWIPMSLNRGSVAGAGCGCTVASNNATSSFVSFSCRSSTTAFTGAGTDVEQLACSYSFNN